MKELFFQVRYTLDMKKVHWVVGIKGEEQFEIELDPKAWVACRNYMERIRHNEPIPNPIPWVEIKEEGGQYKITVRNVLGEIVEGQKRLDPTKQQPIRQFQVKGQYRFSLPRDQFVRLVDEYVSRIKVP